MMESIVEIVQANIHLAPYLICGFLLLAGLNLPISEDIMIFITACLASANKEYFYPLIIGLFLGVYGSDIISYSIGRFLGPQLWKIKWFAKSLKKENVDKVGGYYNKYGIFVLLIGRFIPGGVRNVLFMSAGFMKIAVKKFFLWDLCASALTTTVFFSIYYIFGEKVVAAVKEGNEIILGVFIVACCLFIGYKLIQKRKKKNT